MFNRRKKNRTFIRRWYLSSLKWLPDLMIDFRVRLRSSQPGVTTEEEKGSALGLCLAAGQSHASGNTWVWAVALTSKDQRAMMKEREKSKVFSKAGRSIGHALLLAWLCLKTEESTGHAGPGLNFRAFGKQACTVGRKTERAVKGVVTRPCIGASTCSRLAVSCVVGWLEHVYKRNIGTQGLVDFNLE